MSSGIADPFAYWLVTATDALPPDARRRAAAELTCHYEDALTEYSCQGHDPASAQAAALANLGDAHLVRRQLQGIYLSPLERLHLGVQRVGARLRPALQGMWERRDFVGSLLFGVIVLVAVIHNPESMGAATGCPDPLIPVALAFVLAGRLVERRIGVWTYPAYGYLVNGITAWLLRGPFNGLSSSWLPLFFPGVTFIGFATLALWRARKSGRLRWSLRDTLLSALLIGVLLASDVGGYAVRLQGVTFAHIVDMLPRSLWSSIYIAATLFTGLGAAASGGLAAAVIPMAIWYSVFARLVDPAHYLTPQGYWGRLPVATAVDAATVILPPVMFFLAMPLWIRAASSPRGRMTALVVCPLLPIVMLPLVNLSEFRATYAAFDLVHWVRYGREGLMALLLLGLTAMLYRRFDEGAPVAEPLPAGAPSGSERRLVRLRLFRSLIARRPVGGLSVAKRLLSSCLLVVMVLTACSAPRTGDWSDGDFTYNFTHYAQAVRRVLEINEELPGDRKIRVIAMQIGWSPQQAGYDEITAGVQEAKAAGMLIVCSSMEDETVHRFRFHGLGRLPLSDPDDSQSYEPGLWWTDQFTDDGGV